MFSSLAFKVASWLMNYNVIYTVKISKFQNKLMKSLFLPKYELKIVRISEEFWRVVVFTTVGISGK